jgi:sugar phosphate isomerase/epimerase
MSGTSGRAGMPMEPGIFTKIFPRQGFAEVFDAVRGHDLHQVQLIMRPDGDEALLDDIPAPLTDEIRAESERTGVGIPAVSGIYNMAHPNPAYRQAGLERLQKVIAAAPLLGATGITLCTGTRDPNNMWSWHPDNDSAEAWNDLVESLEIALDDAKQHGITLAFEPEPGNLINSIDRAGRLLDQLDHPNLGVTLDGANIVMTDMARNPVDVLDHAFARFGDKIAIVHAKDCTADGEMVPADRGIVPWNHLARLLKQTGFDGPLILHSLNEDEVDDAVDTIAAAIEAA